MDMETQPIIKTTYLVQFRSPSGKVHTSNIPVFEGQDPETFALCLAKCYKLHFNKFKRVLFRGVLLQKPVVSVVKFAKITNIHHNVAVGDKIFIQEEILDRTLTAALNKPAILHGLDRDSFFDGYSHTVIGTDGSVPNAAILVNFIDNPSALKVVRIAGTVISVGFGIGGAFGLSL
ncbi:hypothetical protein FSPOR_3037 [Fusarium sporotrichioides]|uniref:Uncharacterized protein n=1 Tax=Fusarium sporotrichioides TaxID=5514 RepID=A0A395SIL4_FUSSP|nr:hypothetical protein FSPOR_3037 [Fusarium sporotrichioides]